MQINLQFGWIAILVGLLAGTGIGLFFHSEAWLGGYASWRRRMLRLGHISLVGTGLLNLAFALTASGLSLGPASMRLPSVLFIAGGVTMPLVCFLAAWRRGMRQLFFVPVLCLVGATLLFVIRGLLP